MIFDTYKRGKEEFMKLFKIECPNCGGKILVDDDKEKGVCVCCDSEFFFEDEVKKLQKKNADEIANLVDLSFDLIEQRKYISAEKIIDDGLKIYPYSGKLYLAKLMVDLSINDLEKLSNYGKDYSKNQNYKRAIKYLFDDERNKLLNYCELNKANIGQI